MKTIKYDKLVRDRIPERIRANGVTPVTHIASAEEFRSKVLGKLVEEAEELAAKPSVEEAADVMEVFLAICKDQGWSLEEIELVRREKAARRGGFEERIILEETKE